MISPPVLGSLPLAQLDVATLLLGLLTLLVVGLAAGLLHLHQAMQELRRDMAKLRAAPAPVAPPPAAAPAPAPAVAVAAAANDGRVTPGEIAAILAAIHALFGKEAVLVAVTPVQGSAQVAWSMEGRREVFRSHQIR